jgi:hypothetical protein
MTYNKIIANEILPKNKIRICPNKGYNNKLSLSPRELNLVGREIA